MSAWSRPASASASTLEVTSAEPPRKYCTSMPYFFLKAAIDGIDDLRVEACVEDDLALGLGLVEVNLRRLEWSCFRGSRGGPADADESRSGGERLQHGSTREFLHRLPPIRRFREERHGCRHIAGDPLGITPAIGTEPQRARVEGLHVNVRTSIPFRTREPSGKPGNIPAVRRPNEDTSLGPPCASASRAFLLLNGGWRQFGLSQP